MDKLLAKIDDLNIEDPNLVVAFTLGYLNHPRNFEYARQALGGFVRNGVREAYVHACVDEALNDL